MNKQRCQSIREMLVGYADGELAPALTGKVTEHLAACPSCRREAENLRRSLELARSLWDEASDRVSDVQVPPAAGISVNRDLSMFRAGRMSVRRRSRAWQAAAAVLVVALGASVAMQSLQRPSQRVVYVTVEKDRPAPVHVAYADTSFTTWQPRSGEPSYPMLRDEVLRCGLDALPEPQFSATEPEPDELLENLLGRPRRRKQPDRPHGFWNLLRIGDRS
ncbi:MAG: zf-HC2 domain-containing protein [Phycisphaerae bacterium]|nr:zf-HC2 domain-containing protein [Phycisphaerae bacterium]